MTQLFKVTFLAFPAPFVEASHQKKKKKKTATCSFLLHSQLSLLSLQKGIEKIILIVLFIAAVNKGAGMIKFGLRSLTGKCWCCYILLRRKALWTPCQLRVWKSRSSCTSDESNQGKGAESEKNCTKKQYDAADHVVEGYTAATAPRWVQMSCASPALHHGGDVRTRR